MARAALGGGWMVLVPVLVLVLALSLFLPQDAFLPARLNRLEKSGSGASAGRAVGAGCISGGGGGGDGGDGGDGGGGENY
ncbi:hypothetical protein BDY21DRAFT_159873 [Lineolata rhizophorae]|uniref:Uncharacterized protein n=1 Tax=Lineolata rhizophorae TaxID=578093 RepID=A0A6A6P8T9_9PEZI|nr:hypothetical protein BDY21DRAFT_159873 [Lineolata rhizophorae]